jgi:hypothetical protein
VITASCCVGISEHEISTLKVKRNTLKIQKKNIMENVFLENS